MAYGTVPDVVVGVDFGMTCTGVAYSKRQGDDWPDPWAIQEWPGGFGSSLANKVKTAIGYDGRKPDTPVTWGFHCDPDDETIVIEQLFKLHMDPDYPECIENPETHVQAKQFFRDYLSRLHDYVLQHLADQDARFASRKIDFVFSVPTTWKHPALFSEIESLIKQAGFGSQRNHSAEITLTEAEAAAVSALKQHMQEGDVLLVCDAGGGTTDVNILKVKSVDRRRTRLEPLTINEGQSAGGALIDFEFEEKLLQRLQHVAQILQKETGRSIESTARKMMRERYETFKHNLGAEGSTQERLLMPIPDFPSGRDYPSAGIEESRVVFHRDEIQELFDKQIGRICEIVDKQLRKLRETHAGETVTSLVLSGGLGKSPYVKSALRKRYEGGGGGLHVNAESITVICAAKPQLAVVEGLVIARTKELGGVDILNERVCPQSYGILCRERYDPRRHQGADVTIDPIDGKRWAERQIKWVIREGDLVRRGDGTKNHFRGKVAIGDRYKPWRVRIVQSTLPRDQLPKFITRHASGSVTQVCEITLELTEQDLRLKNDKWYHLKKKHFAADFDVKAVVGNGLKFQVWSRDRNGEQGLMSKDHNEIYVAWESPQNRSSPKQGQGEGVEFYPK